METATDASTTDPLFPPGFRFYPTEEELLGFYLRHRLAGTRPDVERLIPVVDIYSYHPRDLRSMASVRDTEQWFFFCPRAAREAHGGRPARTTPAGYWKATGSPSWVFSASADRRVVGEKRTMVFYRGRAPAGAKTRWKMNEYKAVADPVSLRDVQLRNEFSVCRVYISTGTLRSFDRRPLNHDHHAAVLHHRQQQQMLVPAPPAATSTSNNLQLAADVFGGNGRTETSHDSSSSGSRGTMVTNGSATVDWDSLVLPRAEDDGLSFSAGDLARANSTHAWCDSAKLINPMVATEGSDY